MNSEARRTFPAEAWRCACRACGRGTTVHAYPVRGGLTAYECAHCGARNVARMDAGRRQADKTADLDAAIIETILTIDYRLGPRALAYAMESRGLIAKTEPAFDKVQRRATILRRQGRLPFQWISDDSRSIAYVERYDGLAAAMREWQRTYRRDMWHDKAYAAEVWIEKAGMVPAIEDVTERYGVPVYIAKGFSGLSFIYDAAQSIRRRGKPTFIAHLGDYDKAGQDAARAIERDLRGFGAPVSFTQLAITREQIEAWRLPTRPPKPRDRGFKGCVELDAVPGAVLRDELAAWLRQHMTDDELHANDVAEQAERGALARWATARTPDPGPLA